MVRREAELGGALGIEAPADPELVAHRTLPYNSNNRNEDH
jgi:hypothetical protein